MTARRQVELQLGHMCNNRCVFCVSGQETALGRARPVEVEPVIAQLEAARAAGADKVTLLGGEPTLQPGFLDVVRAAVALGFGTVEVFTNGARTAREAFVDEVIEAGAGRLVWRLSFQGATREAHEATTGKPGSFDRLMSTLAHLRARSQVVTVNLCVVRSNHASLAEFAAFLPLFGVRQLHLDMMRPLDAGQRTDAELDATLPRYRDLAAPLAELARRLPPGFDLNIGNLPHCVAPDLARWIHHDGEPTDMVAVDGEQRYTRPLDKYLTKRRDKLHPPGCARCAFAARCSGVFETYARLRGVDELRPVDLDALDALDPEQALRSPRWRLWLRPWTPPAPWAPPRLEERGDHELLVHMEAPGSRLSVALRPPGPGAASSARASVHVVQSAGDRAALAAGLRALWERVADGATVLHPLGDDAIWATAPTVGARLGRLRRRAPFGELRWQGVRVSENGARAEAELVGPAGEAAVLWLTETGGRAAGGYRVVTGEATAALVEGLGQAIAALRTG